MKDLTVGPSQAAVPTPTVVAPPPVAAPDQHHEIANDAPVPVRQDENKVAQHKPYAPSAEAAADPNTSDKSVTVDAFVDQIFAQFVSGDKIQDIGREGDVLPQIIERHEFSFAYGPGQRIYDAAAAFNKADAAGNKDGYVSKAELKDFILAEFPDLVRPNEHGEPSLSTSSHWGLGEGTQEKVFQGLTKDVGFHAENQNRF